MRGLLGRLRQGAINLGRRVRTLLFPGRNNRRANPVGRGSSASSSPDANRGHPRATMTEDEYMDRRTFGRD